jgi:DNA-binding protein HU-beta
MTEKTTLASKDDLVVYISKDLDITKVDAAAILESVTTGIVELSKIGDGIRVPNLGIFSVQQTEARQGRNPRTGELVDVAANKRVSFRAAKSFKVAINSDAV